MNQYIYVVGGYDGSQQLASVERYDTERDSWELVAPVHIARSALSLTVLDNKLYALGQYINSNSAAIGGYVAGTTPNLAIRPLRDRF